MEENKWDTVPEGRSTFPDRGRCARFARDEVMEIINNDQVFSIYEESGVLTLSHKIAILILTFEQKNAYFPTVAG